MKQGTISAVFIVGAAMWLAACSSGGDGGAGGGTPVAAPTLTGTFVDAPVAGLPYATSSGLGGTTNAQGQFSYRSGDTVTFSYGQNVSNPIPAAPMVTPWTMFGLNSPDPADPRWINLARLLQTFNNVLPPVTPAIQALPAVNFPQSTADFEADPTVGPLLTAANAPQPLVSAAQARQVLSQQFTLLGSWFAQNQPGFGANFVVFTAMADGTYVVSEDGSSDPTGIDGMERGTYTYDQATGAFTGTIQRDTNGANGLAGPPSLGASLTMTVNGNTLTVGQSDNYTRVIDTAVPANPAVGAWRFDNTDGPGTLAVLTLFADGAFVLVTDEVAPGSDGIERGLYSIANGNVTFTKTIDTNSASGFFNPAVPGPTVEQIAIAGDTMTLTSPGEPSLTGTRIRPPQ
ncbi:MAG: hypothetical protein AAB433_10085 [Nitrospirota bacterium]